MKVTLTLNVGKPDAARLGLTKTLEGQTVDVPQAVADELLKKGWAVPEDSKTESLKGTGTPTTTTPK